MIQKYEKSAVLGSLKATGSRDVDILRAAVAQQLQIAKFQKFQGTLLLIFGIPASLIIIGIPFALFGWWIRRLGVTNIQTIESALSEVTTNI